MKHAFHTSIKNLNTGRASRKNISKKLEQLGIKTVRDFLYFFPHRYDDFSKITKIADAQTGRNRDCRRKNNRNPKHPHLEKKNEPSQKRW